MLRYIRVGVVVWTLRLSAQGERDARGFVHIQEKSPVTAVLGIGIYCVLCLAKDIISRRQELNKRRVGVRARGSASIFFIS